MDFLLFFRGSQSNSHVVTRSSRSVHFSPDPLIHELILPVALSIPSAFLLYRSLLRFITSSTITNDIEIALYGA